MLWPLPMYWRARSTEFTGSRLVLPSVYAEMPSTSTVWRPASAMVRVYWLGVKMRWASRPSLRETTATVWVGAAVAGAAVAAGAAASSSLPQATPIPAIAKPTADIRSTSRRDIPFVSRCSRIGSIVLLSPGVGTVEVTTDLDFEEPFMMAFPSLILLCSTRTTKPRVSVDS